MAFEKKWDNTTMPGYCKPVFCGKCRWKSRKMCFHPSKKTLSHHHDESEEWTEVHYSGDFKRDNAENDCVLFYSLGTYDLIEGAKQFAGLLACLAGFALLLWGVGWFIEWQMR